MCEAVFITGCYVCIENIFRERCHNLPLALYKTCSWVGRSVKVNVFRKDIREGGIELQLLN